MQLMTAVSPQLEALKKEGETGRKKINQYTRYGTVLIAGFQAFGISAGLEGMSSSAGPAVMDPGAFFRFQVVVTLIGGTIFLMWLGEQITARGVGNGISLIIFSGIVANLPSALAGTLELGRTGALSTAFIIFLLLMSVGVIYFIVFVERAQRRIIVQYPKRQRGNKMTGGESSHLPLKINTAGVIPPIFASSLLLMPITVIGFSAGSGPEWLTNIAAYLGRGQPVYLLIYISMVVFFAFFYTAVVFNPTETADNLKRYGGFIPGIRPGKNTAEYLDWVLTRPALLCRRTPALEIPCLPQIIARNRCPPRRPRSLQSGEKSAFPCLNYPFSRHPSRRYQMKRSAWQMRLTLVFCVFAIWASNLPITSLNRQFVWEIRVHTRPQGTPPKSNSLPPSP